MAQRCREMYHLLLLSVLLISWNKADGQAFVEERACGSLYSENYFQGNEFNLKDFDQSINLRKDFRVNIDGWRDTKSIRVKDNCTMHICSQTYMQGGCQSLRTGDHNSSQIIFPIQSANCTCSRSCKCEDTFIPKNAFICGRIYIVDGCNACNSQYLKLFCSGSASFPSSHRNAVKSIILRSGCALEIFSMDNYGGQRRDVDDRILENFTGSMGSYKITCNDDLYISHRKSFLYPPSIGNDEMLSNVSRRESFTPLPGLNAALQSFVSGRSNKNAYIILVGSGWPGDIGLDTCNGNYIGECRLQVRCDVLGLPNPQLRVIYVWVQDDLDMNARYAATLEKYLSTNEDLKNAIPNAVVVWHYPLNDTSIAKKTSRFQRKLAFVNALRGRLLDEENSNLLIVLSDLHELPKPSRENPDEIIADYENVIKNWNFPHPTSIVPFHYDKYRELPNVNGYMKMQNEEYWPKNLEAQLVLVAKRSGDQLGQAIFKATYPEEKDMSKGMDTVIERFPSYHTEVSRYRNLLSNENIFASNDTDAIQAMRYQLFEKQLQIFPNKAILGVLKIQEENIVKMLDVLKAKHESDILLKQEEINELRQELTSLRKEVRNRGPWRSGWK